MTAVMALVGALINLGGPGHYLHWGFLQISLANVIVIIVMVLTFVAAVFIPVHRRKDRS
jgi:NADH:ubiquinone oxidoreductase subunit 6 (subunit J)